MRVLTWNINGVRTLPQYYPWNTLKTFNDILNQLEADIICFQEMKSSRQGLSKQVALPPSFDSFFSFPARKTGYSGVAVYARPRPLKAEEGLSGLVQPRPPLTAAERISPDDLFSSNVRVDNDDELDYKDLDSEGRALVIDFGLFILINVYCPNDAGTEERAKFKMDYHRLLEIRVNRFIQDGREVVVVGDLNACAAVQDHCEGELMVARGLAEGLQGEEGFWGADYRRWMKDWLQKEDGTGGCMVDIVRRFWPGRKGMYTCWNTKISARDTNYGTRIDFILVTPNLVPWIKAADIQPLIKGSDHCPVFIDLHDEITKPDGTVVKLSDILGAQPEEAGYLEPPRLAAKFWDEHRQSLLSSFFGKKSGDSLVNKIASQSNDSSQAPSIVSPHTSESSPSSTPSTPIDITAAPSDSLTHENVSLFRPLVTSGETAKSSVKRKLTSENIDVVTKKPSLTQNSKSNIKSKSKDKKYPGQSTLAGFFAQSSQSGSGSKSEKQKQQHNDITSSSVSGIDLVQDSAIVEGDLDADYRLALLLSQSDDNILPSSSQGSSSSAERTEKKDASETKQVWTSLLAPTQAPRCVVHGEPAKEFTVNKPGPNKGKKFYVCSRPVGPGYDKGRAERPREQVDPQWKCNFFMWASDARKEMSRSVSS